MTKPHSASLRRIAAGCFTFVVLAFALSAAATPRALAQRVESLDPERERAMRLFDENKFTEALPLLEKVVAADAEDVVALERLGFILVGAAKLEKDPQKRQKMRERGRDFLLRAQKLGDDSALMKAGLEAAEAPDAATIPLSANKEAEAAMHEGEQAFMRGELDKAISAYERAIKLDPNLYEAALFAGDSYFKKKEWDKSAEWFARAVRINPDRETAYRYWGDALMMGQNKKDESRDKFIEAVIAEPYNRGALVGLVQWGQKYRVQLAHPNIEPPFKSSTEGNNTTINIDPKMLLSQDGSSNWLIYNITRTGWQKGTFAKEFPAEKTYRHSLREESDALRMVAQGAANDLKSGKVKKLEQTLATLVKLHNEGLLEAYILLARPDEGIARDYAAYRKENRDKLRRYLTEYVVLGNF